MKLLIGQISYLNSQPFYPLLGEHRLVAMPPRRLGELARRGEIDAGIMATADYLALSDRYEPLGDLGIANREEVRSIIFFSKRPWAELADARIGVTEETSTSARLLRLILEARYGVKPARYERGLRGEADAYLVIGNEALTARHRPPADFPHRYDLASEWWSWKKLPFVFALWAVKRSLPESAKREFLSLLERSLSKGMAEIDAIAARHAGELGDARDLASYLRNFRYRFGPDEKRGLLEFERLVRERNLLESL